VRDEGARGGLRAGTSSFLTLLKMEVDNLGTPPPPGFLYRLEKFLWLVFSGLGGNLIIGVLLKKMEFEACTG
jgi:hypothetical protein